MCSDSLSDAHASSYRAPALAGSSERGIMNANNVVAITAAKNDEKLVKLIDDLSHMQNQHLSAEGIVKTAANVVEQLLALNPAISPDALRAAISLVEHRREAKEKEADRVHRLANPFPPVHIGVRNVAVFIGSSIQDKVQSRKSKNVRLWH